MGDMQIGVVLFVLIIVVGLIAGLALSATAAQRRAVAVAFISMGIVAALFYVFAMRGSQLWTAPLFAAACIVVPIGSYAVLMRSQDSAERDITRRNPVEVPRGDLPEGVSRTLRTGSALETAASPVVPVQPLEEFPGVGGYPDFPGYQGFPDYQDSSAFSAVGEFQAPDGYRELYLEEDEFELAEDIEESFGPAAGLDSLADMESDEFELAEDMESDEFELAEDMGKPGVSAVSAIASEEADALEDVDLAEPPSLASSRTDDSLSQEPTPSLPMTPAEQLLDEALMEESPDKDESGLFEPELMPDPHAAEPSTAVTATSVVAVPGEEGDEQFLVVSESTSAPNPLMAYKRTTSSHLVPLGSSKPAFDEPVQNVPPQPEPDPYAPLQTTASYTASVPASPVQGAQSPATAMRGAQVPEPIELAREADLTSPASTAVIMSVVSRELEAMRQSDPALDGSSAMYGGSADVQPSLFDQPPAAEVSFYDEPAAVAEDLFGASETEPAVTSVPYEPSIGNPSEVIEAASVAAFEPTFEPAPQPAREPVVKPKASFSYQPLVIGAAPEASASAQAAEAAFAPSAVSAAAVNPESAPEPEETPFERAVSKADTLRDRELYPVAARLYAQAAIDAPTNDERRHVQFEEIMCYLKAGQNDKVRELAAQLRSSSVLTRVERIKLDAIERMG